MSASRSKDTVFLMKKPYQLAYSAKTHFHGDLLQGESKRTAGKDRLFYSIRQLPSCQLNPPSPFRRLDRWQHSD